MSHPRPPHWGTRTLRDLLCGALIGAGAILPGVSGGVLAVVFGVYQPFMETLTHPRTAIPNYWCWAIPLGLGWAVGFLGLAKGIAAAMVIKGNPLHLKYIDKAGEGILANVTPEGRVRNVSAGTAVMRDREGYLGIPRKWTQGWGQGLALAFLAAVLEAGSRTVDGAL